MEQATRLYKQYLEDARNLAKIGNDEVTLLKAIAFANIANAIGSTGFVNISEVIEEDNGVKAESESKDNRKFVEGKASLKRTPNPKEETAKTAHQATSLPRTSSASPIPGSMPVQ